ncbi:glycosyltransferase [Candidatus Pelagibacter sp.]|nr:glycosyltransferase [Candidatus Pelagibacter sp.]
MVKKRILVFSGHYIPGYKGGGPIRSLENIFNQLSEDIDFYLVTSNRDAGDKKPYKGINANTWTIVGKVSVFYIDGNYIKKSAFNEILEKVQPDTIYLNSLFSLSFGIYILWLLSISRFNRIRLLLAPRGELLPGALKVSKIKKFFFILITKHLKIYKNLQWHASSELEFADIKKQYDNYREIYIASNLVNDTELKSYNVVNLTKNKGEIRIIFLSRITKKKNLDFAIKSLSNLNGDVIFDIYGPHEDQDYIKKCKKLVLNLPSNIIVSFKGDIMHDKISQLFVKYDVFYFPTKSENFGQVIWESLSCGCPVLISDQTPWNNIDSYNVGWVRSLSKMNNFSKVLQGIIDNNLEYQFNRQKIYNYALKFANNNKAIIANKKMFNNE